MLEVIVSNGSSEKPTNGLVINAPSHLPDGDTNTGIGNPRSSRSVWAGQPRFDLTDIEQPLEER